MKLKYDFIPSPKTKKNHLAIQKIHKANDDQI